MSTSKSSLGFAILGAALGFGLLADFLLREYAVGLNLSFWVTALCVTFLFLYRRFAPKGDLAVEGSALALLLPAVGFAWRDSKELAAVNAFTLLVGAVLLVTDNQLRKLREAGVGALLLGGFVTKLAVLFGPLALFVRDTEWNAIPRRGAFRHLTGVLRGLIIAVPCLVVFGALLSSADEVFAGLLRRLVVPPEQLVRHGLVIGVAAWLVGGLLWGMLAPPAVPLSPDRIAGPKFGLTEITTVLGLVNLLFLAFVLVQVRYFFGGSEWVHASASATYSEYARRGFFELTAVAALSLPLLLATHWVLDASVPRAARWYGFLAGSQVALLFVILASAVGRMRLYQLEYGMTSLRFYTMAFMGWLALVFVWFLWTVPRGKRDGFMLGSVVLGFTVVGALNLANPDDWIVRHNLERAVEGKSLDTDYCLTFSDDAVPAILDNFHRIPEIRRGWIARQLLNRRQVIAGESWKSLNLARERAGAAIDRQDAVLRACALPVGSESSR